MGATERLALVVTANASQAVTELNKVGSTAKTELGKAERSIDQLSNKMIGFGAASVAGGLVASRAIYQAVQATQDLADSGDKASAVFGSAKGLESFAAGAADSMGLSKAAALDAASAYGLLLQQSGLAGAALAQQSAQLATRTADLAELYKKPYAEVQKSIEAVLKTGSAKSLKGLLGVDIQIDPDQFKGLDTATKTARILDEVLRQTATAAGTFAASTDDVGVQIAQAQAKWENAKASFGEAALPGITRLVEAGTSLLDMFDRLPGPMKEVLAVATTLGAATAVLGGGLSVAAGGVLKMTPGLKAAKGTFDAAGGGMAGLSAAAGGLSVTTLGLTAAVAGGIGVYEAWSSAAAEVETTVRGLADGMAALTSQADVLPFLAQQLATINEGSSEDGAFSKTGLSIREVSAALASAPGSFDKFRDEVDGFGEALQRLGDTEGQSFGDAIGDIRNTADRAGPAVSGVVNSLADLYEAGALSRDEFRAIVDDLADFDQGLQRTSRQTKDQAKELWAVVPAAARAGEALALYKTATDKTAGSDAQQKALIELKRLFPEAAAAAGLMAAAMGQVDEQATTTAESFKTVGSAISSVTSANARVTAAQKRLADVTTGDAKKIESAWDRLIDAKQRLDDILAGDGNNLEQESPAAQEARARARLMDANARLAQNPNDARAQTDKDEALGDIDRAINRGQEMARSAQETGRQIRDANEDIAKAQEEYAEAVKPANADEIKAAQADLAAAEADRAAALEGFATSVNDGSISLDAYSTYLNDLVAKGIISPESAQILKDQMGSAATEAGLLAAALGQATKALTGGGFLTSAINAATGRSAASFAGRTGTGGGSTGSATVGVRIPGTGVYIDVPVPGRATGGSVTAGTEYRVNERGDEMFIPGVSGYVLNAQRTKQATGRGGGGTTWNVKVDVNGSGRPAETAAHVVAKMRAAQFRKTA